MTTNIIKAGYRLTVVSWENDGDNYNTVTIDGLSKEKCSMYVECCALTQDEFGNMYEPSNKEIDAFENACKVIINKYKDLIALDFYATPFEETEIIDYFCDLSLSRGEYFTRVCESFIVEYIPEDIIIQNVTSEFGELINAK